MKKLILLVPAFIFASGCMMFYGCSTDENEYRTDDLSIKYQIARSTRASPEFSDPTTSYQFNQGECGIWCILKLQGKTNSYSTYNQVCDSAKTLGWPDDGNTPLYGEQMKDLGNMYNIGFSGIQSNKDKYGNYIGCATNKLNEILNDASGTYDSNNDGNIDHVILSINDNTHYVVLKGTKKDDSSKIEVYDPNSTNPNHTTSISKASVSGIIY